MAQPYFSTSFFRFFFSIRVTKSQNEFEMKAVTWTNGWCHGTRKFENRAFDEILKFSVCFSHHFTGNALRVHPVGTRLTVHRRLYVTRSDFKCGGCSRPNFSKSVNSFVPTVFFHKFSRLFLSIRAVKSQNEFETKAVTLNHGGCHVTRKFRKSKIS